MKETKTQINRIVKWRINMDLDHARSTEKNLFNGVQRMTNE